MDKYSNPIQLIVPNKPYKTPEGFLVVDVILAKKGVLDYQYADASGNPYTRPELLGDAIFDENFVQSFNGSPFVLEHPVDDNGNDIVVTPENYPELIKGVIIDPVAVPAIGEVRGKLKVYDADIIKAIESGELVEVSQGYTCRIVPNKGSYNGKEYEVEQTDLTINHLALVENGRAGYAVRVLYNNKRNSKTAIINLIEKNNRRKNTMPEKEMDIKSPADGTTARANEELVGGEEAPAGGGLEEVLKALLEGQKATNEMLAQLIKGESEEKEMMSESMNAEPSEDEKDKDKAVMQNVKNSAQLAADWQKTTIRAGQILGQDYVNELVLKSNSILDIKRAAIVASGLKSETDCKRLNAAQVSAYFDAACDAVKFQVNSAKIGGGMSSDTVMSDSEFYELANK